MKTDASAGFSEEQRQRILAAYPLDNDTISGQLERLAALAARSCHAPVGLVSLVETDRQVFVGRHGTDVRETPREQSFCAHAMLLDECMIVPDAAKDPRFYDNPLVTGGPQIRFYAGQPLRSAEGAPLGSFCVIDTIPREGLTPQQRDALETLAIAATGLLERARIERERTDFEARSSGTIEELQQRFTVLADTMPQLVWSTDAGGSADYFNQGWLDYTGAPAKLSHGRGWMDFLHPDDVARAAEVWLGAVANGESYDVEYRLRNHDGAYRWMLARGEPIKSADGTIVRWVGTCTDIDEQKDAALRQEVLSRELNHRIKNIFAVIGGLVSLTSRAKPEAAEAARELQDRILALGRAHDYVRVHHPDGEGARRPSHSSLTEMLAELLAPYQDAEGTRITILGDDLPIDDRSATPLALFFHELATNAAKYGGLSTPSGRVAITIAAGDEVVLEWTESGGPPAIPPARSGFGTRLVEMSVVRQLGGELDTEWRSEGARLTARIPASAMMR